VRADAAAVLDDADGDLQQLQAQRVELGPGQRMPLGDGGADPVHEPERGRGQHQADLVGDRGMARGAVGRELRLVQLDQVLRLAPLAVDALVKPFGIALERGYDVAHVDLLAHRVRARRRRVGLQRGLDARDHPARPRPAAGPMPEGRVAPHLRLGRPRMPEAQMIRYLGHFPVERGVAGEAEDVAGTVVVAPVHGLGAAVVTVAAPDDAGPLPGLQDALGQVPDHGAHLAALRRLRRPQDRRDGQARAGVVDVHRGKATLVVVRIPERQLLAAVSGVEGVVDIEDVAVARRHGACEMIDERTGEPRRVRLRRRILEAADGRLRGERAARFRAAADRHLHRWIVAQRVVVDAVLVAAADADDARADDLAQLMDEARRVAPVAQSRCHPRDDAEPLLGSPEQQHAGVRRLVATVEIDCELLPGDGWQIEGKRDSLRHGRGVPLRPRHARFDNGLLRDFNALRHGHRRFFHA